MTKVVAGSSIRLAAEHFNVDRMTLGTSRRNKQLAPYQKVKISHLGTKMWQGSNKYSINRWKMI